MEYAFFVGRHANKVNNFKEKKMSRNDYDASYIGDGYGIGSGGFGGSSILWFVILIIFAVLFMRRDGHDGNCGCGCGCGIASRPTFYDESNHEEEKNLKQDIYTQEEKTRGLIVHEAEKQAAREYQKELFEKAELKNKIYLLENEKYTDMKFDKLTALVQHDYNSLYREIERRPAAAPCFAPTCTAPLCQPCLMNPCGLGDGYPRRCDC
jgi:hypothetical protein